MYRLTNDFYTIEQLLLWNAGDAANNKSSHCSCKSTLYHCMYLAHKSVPRYNYREFRHSNVNICVTWRWRLSHFVCLFFRFQELYFLIIVLTAYVTDTNQSRIARVGGGCAAFRYSFTSSVTCAKKCSGAVSNTLSIVAVVVALFRLKKNKSPFHFLLLLLLFLGGFRCSFP